MLIAARNTIDSVDRVPGVADNLSPVGVERSRTSCWSAPTAGRVRSDVGRCRRHRDRRRRVGSSQRHDHDPAARQVHRRRRRCCRFLATCGCRCPATTASGGSTRRSTTGRKCSCRRLQQASSASRSITTSRSTSPASSRSSMRWAACEICVDYATRDVSTGLNITEPGCHVLDGEQALAYARSRHYEEFREDGEVARGSGLRSRPHEAPAAVRQPRAADGAGPHQGRSVRRRPAGRLRSVRRCASTTSSTRSAAAASLRSAVDGGIATYSLPVFGKTIGGNAVLLLGDGSDAVLAYFRGEGPAPAANA